MAGKQTRPVTIADVARRAGVSNGTVSRYNNSPDVVSAATRERIRAAIEELGYAPNLLARSFRVGHTGIVLVLTTWISDPFYGDVIAGIVRVARAKGYTVRIEELDAEPLSASDLGAFVASRQADGIVVLGSPWPFRRGAAGQDGAEHAIVVCGETADPELMRYPRFQIDGHAAALEITCYLAGLGHERIGFIGNAGSTVPLLEREHGYREGLSRSGINPDPEWLSDGGESMEESRRAARSLLNAQRRPTAIVCATDEIALAAMAEIRDAGLSVPGHVSVTGFDDTRYAAVSNPGLTTIAQPAGEIGERAMHRLLKDMSGPGAGAGVEHLPYQLVIRRSASSPPFGERDGEA
ncbi:LacI family DNA-binding transcriptional regulator [Mangrovicoccus sp. HB161399]|uniref:LacI family DNA-binding transcriptional regulator n=1 Tax=Mangrovicoccus sp. HB161399 TaxID=2720392 RepID=UPI001555A4EC|nr:LacI family DNA-binding transcriptional regulator [Mangrovicoccus sp. HB161399]